MIKNKKLIAIISVALILSIIAGVGVYQFFSPERTTIYIFNDSYSAGKQINADMLTPMQVDANIVIANKKSNISQQYITSKEYPTIIKNGEVLRTNVTKGVALTPATLSITGGSQIEMSMKSTAVAITIPVTNTTGVTSELKSNSRVNIYATSADGMQTVLLFQDMRILQVSKTDGKLNSVTVEVELADSLKLVNAATNSTLYLGLIDMNGYQYTDEYLSYSVN